MLMSSAEPELLETDFTEQMNSLAAQAGARVEDRRVSSVTLLQMFRPVVLGLEALGRATSENALALEKLEETVAAQAALPEMMGQVRESLEAKTAVNQQLFDALHAELRNYKDGFLAEVMHKPIIHDLISLYDDFSEIHRQISDVALEHEAQASLDGKEPQAFDRLGTTAINLDHGLEFLLEILARIGVKRVPNSTGRLNKATQRAVSMSLAESAEEDGMVAQSVKPGFKWKERLIRPEEVIVKRWKEGFVVALAAASSR